MGKIKHSKAMGFSNIWGEAEIHTIRENMKKVDFHSKGKAWEKTDIFHIPTEVISKPK